MNFLEPVPRVAPIKYSKVSWPVSGMVELPIPSIKESIWPPLTPRRTTREFGPISLEEVGGLLWHTARCQETEPSDLGFDLQFRPVPSGGAIHPIHVLVEHSGSQWARYEPLTHQLQLLDPQIDLQGLHTAAEAVLEPGQGRLLAFVAEPGMTQAKYDHWESVVWRDAGVLQGAMVLVASQLKLNMCLLGLTGHQYVAKLGGEGQLGGVGMAIVGSP